MPHTKSAKKQIRQDAKRRARNRLVKKGLRLQIKKVLESATAGNADQLKTELKVAVQKLDLAASRKVIHKNLAARKKSQLARLVNSKAKAPASK